MRSYSRRQSVIHAFRGRGKPGIVTVMSGIHPPVRLLAWLTLCASLWGCALPRYGDSEAGLALEDLASGLATSRLEEVTPPPSRRSISIMAGGEQRTADLYVSPQGARAGIVLVPGVVARGKNDPRLVAVARTLARLRFAVLVPDMPGVRRYRMRASDVGEVADAFTWLISRPELAPQGRAGIGGFSYGAGPVLLAALQPDIRAQVDFVLAVGGYYALRNVITYITTGYYSTDDRLGQPGAAHAIRRPPHPYSEAVFIRSNLDLLERPADRAFLRSYANYITGNSIDEEEPLPAQLAPDAQAFHDLLANHNPARVTALLARLPPRIRTELEGINPAAHDLSEMRANVILLHGRGDTLIPYTESIALANALPEGKAQLIIIDGLAHVDFRPKAHDVPQLLAAMQALLDERLPVPEHERLQPRDDVYRDDF